ncbi:formin-like protein 20 [Panicum virgatum]|uniref:formin-like protein 20 n=1 Tax=Panicum virgatum TaxID=38727 RepID=UPI0019D6670C|nr:formin-like protein 20 [Panicum virgatum]
MASPFPATAGVIKVEDEENGGVSAGRVPSDQELRNKFWEAVKRGVELRKRDLCASGSAQLPPPPLPPPDITELQVLQPTNNYSRIHLHSFHLCYKQHLHTTDFLYHVLLCDAPAPQVVQPPPPPPPAHHPWAKRPATAPPPGFAGVRQPPAKQYQRRPPGQRASAPRQHPAPNACRALLAPPAPPPAHAAGPGAIAAMPPPLQRRSAPPPKPPRHHPAAKKKKPTVPCAFCGVLCMTAWHLEQHEKGRKHRNKVAYLAGEMNVQCPVCDVHLSGELNVQQHFAGKQHIWRLKLNGGA